VRGAFEAFVGADDADIVPHEAPKFVPIVRDDDFLVRIGHPAFIPWPDVRQGCRHVPARRDVIGNRLAEH
jgi:hypothetical protein